MNVRALAVIAATGAALCVPTVAFAEEYPSAEDSLSCSATIVEAGRTVDCSIAGPNGSEATLQVTTSGADARIAGTVTSAPRTIADNVADFTVTVPNAAGTVGLTAIIDGVEAATASVEVTATGAGGTDAGLSGTGFDNLGLVVGAGALVAAGVTVVMVAARRRSTHRD